MRSPINLVWFRFLWLCAVLSVLVAFDLPVQAEKLVELELVSRKRHFTPKSPVEKIAQEFRITGPGVLTVQWVTDPHQGANGGHWIQAKDGSPLYLGREVIREEAPKPLVVGSKYSLKQVIMVPNATQALQATLTAWWAPQAMQVANYGEQLPAIQRLNIEFVPVDLVAKQSGAPAATDISGTWRYDSGSGETWTFTPKGDGLYEAVENGYGKGKGIAKVSGRTVTIEYTNQTPYKDQKSGVFVLDVGSEGNAMSGGWLTNNGENGTTSLTRTSQAPKIGTQPVPQPPPAGVDPQRSGYGAQADSLRGRNGERFTFSCPAGASPSGRLWGTDLYTDDSSVCTAAVHAGLITLAQGGNVTIEIRPGAKAYKGSQRNGIESKDWGAHPGSFIFVGAKTQPIGEPATVSGMTLQAGKREAKPGETVTVPVYLIKGSGVADMNFNVTFNTSVAQATQAAKGSLIPAATLFEANTGQAGNVRMGFAGNKDFGGTGPLAQLTFKAVGKPGDRTPLKVSVTTIGNAAGGKPTIATIDGEIEIVGGTPSTTTTIPTTTSPTTTTTTTTLPPKEIKGDCDGNGKLNAADALCALKMSVGLIPINMRTDMDNDGKVTSTDARLILQKVVGK